MQYVIGVLDLQGGVAEHIQALCCTLESLSLTHKISIIRVRTPESLQHCHALILPGGESTTLTQSLHQSQFMPILSDWLNETRHKVLGTCAGLILMTKWCQGLEVERNAYGSQQASCHAVLTLTDSRLPVKATQAGFFIRAPRLSKLDSNWHILATCKEEPVAILSKDERFLLLTFHPELEQTETYDWHQFFIQEIVMKS